MCSVTQAKRRVGVRYTLLGSRAQRQRYACCTYLYFANVFSPRPLALGHSSLCWYSTYDSPTDRHSSLPVSSTRSSFFPSWGYVTLKRRCTYRPSVIYLIVNKLLSLSLGPSCVAETRATRPNGEWGYSTRRQCWATSAQRRCHPEEALYLPTFSHLFDCQ